MITTTNQQSYSLDTFEGPLDFLWYLVQKNEIDIYEIAIQDITAQFLSHLDQAMELSMDKGAEFLSVAASLMLVKSRSLLPQETLLDEEEQELDPKFAIIHQLVDYCKFKGLAKALSDKEEEAQGFFHRGVRPPVLEKPPGVEHLSLEELSGMFEELIVRAADNPISLIHEEEWRISDKIRYLRRQTEGGQRLSFKQLFSINMSRGELIVTFLALLELMKLGGIGVVQETETGEVWILSQPDQVQ